MAGVNQVDQGNVADGVFQLSKLCSRLLSSTFQCCLPRPWLLPNQEWAGVPVSASPPFDESRPPRQARPSMHLDNQR